MERVGIVLDVESQSLVGRHQGQRLIVHIGGNAPLGHLRHHMVSLFTGLAQQPYHIQMMRTAMMGVLVVHQGHGQIFQSLVVASHHLLSALQHLGIALQLHQANGSHDIGHVALIPRPDDVVFPSAELRLGQSVLVLSMQGEQLRQSVEQLVPRLALSLRHGGHIVYVGGHHFIAKRQIPGHSPTLGRGEVLHGMEAERAEIANLASHLPLAHATQGMGTVGRHDDTPYLRL